MGRRPVLSLVRRRGIGGGRRYLRILHARNWLGSENKRRGHILQALRSRLQSYTKPVKDERLGQGIARSRIHDE
jgi:hypothetical protein